MSAPRKNPIATRRAYRRFSDERIWREFMAAALSSITDSERAAHLADEAYAEYRNRFPVRKPELDDEPFGFGLWSESPPA